MSLFNRSLSYGAVALPIAALGTHFQGGLPAGATAAVALLGLLMLLGRAHLAGVLPQLGPRSRKVAAPALALVLVGSLALSGAGPAPVESAAAATVNVTCPYGDVMSWFGISNDQCSGPVSSAPDTSTAENKVDIYQDAAEAKAWAETINTQTNNSLINLQTTLYATGQAVQLRAIQNGSSVAQVNQRVNESINERVAKMQYNQLKSWNQRVQSLRGLVSQGMSLSAQSPIYMLNDQNNSNVDKTLYSRNFATSNITLSNGSTKHVQLIAARYEYQGFPSGFGNQTSPEADAVWSVSETPDIVIRGSGSDRDFANIGSMSILVVGPNDQPTLHLFNTSSHPTSEDNWNTLQEKAQLAKSNLAASTPTLVDRYQAGELNVSNVINPSTLWQEYSTRYGETGNLALARATAAAAGYATPSLENVSVMNVTADGLTYTGALFSQTAPDNGTWVLGQTYNATSIPGAQLVATTGGEMVELDGQFTVSAIEGSNGESLNQTHVRNYRYETANVTQLIELQQQLNDLREEVAAQTASSPGGGGSSGISPKMLGAALLLGVGAYLARKGGDDNNRGRR